MKMVSQFTGHQDTIHIMSCGCGKTQFPKNKSIIPILHCFSKYNVFIVVFISFITGVSIYVGKFNLWKRKVGLVEYSYTRPFHQTLHKTLTLMIKPYRYEPLSSLRSLTHHRRLY
jgi:hypothetical protein